MSLWHTHQSSDAVTVYLQDACWKHRFIRSRDNSNVPERPERLRAVMLGLSCAISRLQEIQKSVAPSSAALSISVEGSPGPSAATSVQARADSDLVADALVNSLSKLNISASPFNSSASPDTLLYPNSPIAIVKSTSTVDFFNNPAIKFIHGDIEGDKYLEMLRDLTKDSLNKIAKGDSEIPTHLSQGDLYLCPESLDAMQGAVGTVCEAIDAVVQNTAHPRVFVAVRPPGHHCGEDTPSGFCFVNNVAIGAAHAHIQHKINRVIIFDIDLHHGNGTQSIVSQINEETYRKTIGDDEDQQQPSDPGSNNGLQIYYGSLHDVLSYPCEDGNIGKIQAASTSIHGPHGQYIENIHLETYDSDEQFFNDLYPRKYLPLISKAARFLEETGGEGEDVLVMISCGFDACEHEHPYMSRHGRKVPTSFYHRFTCDAVAFANKYARGRVVSVMEGGYSDRALVSGTMAHVVGLTTSEGDKQEAHSCWKWWDNSCLDKLEALLTPLKKRRGGRPSQTAQPDTSASEPWLESTSTIFSTLEVSSAAHIAAASAPIPASTRSTTALPPSNMTLRDRKGKAVTENAPSASPNSKSSGAKQKGNKRLLAPSKEASSNIVNETVSGGIKSEEAERIPLLAVPPSVPATGVKKLPRVILHVRPPPSSTESGMWSR